MPSRASSVNRWRGSWVTCGSAECSAARETMLGVRAHRAQSIAASLVRCGGDAYRMDGGLADWAIVLAICLLPLFFLALSARWCVGPERY